MGLHSARRHTRWGYLQINWYDRTIHLISMSMQVQGCSGRGSAGTFTSLRPLQILLRRSDFPVSSTKKRGDSARIISMGIKRG